MKRSHLLTLTLFLGLTLLLSACVPGPRVTGTPGIELSEERTFVAFGNFVYSLEIESGAIDWQFPDQANNQVVFYSQPLVTDEFVYVGDLANNFHKLDIETGELAWTFSESRGYYVGQAAEAIMLDRRQKRMASFMRLPMTAVFMPSMPMVIWNGRLPPGTMSGLSR